MFPRPNSAHKQQIESCDRDLHDQLSLIPRKPYWLRSITPKVKEIAPSGFLQDVRLVKVTLPPQEENLGQPRF